MTIKAVILDGASPGDSFAVDVRRALIEKLRNAGYSVECFVLAELQIAYCLGDFKCWTRTPGICALDDDNRIVAKAAAQCDLLFFLTPVTFGGYSSNLKKAVDHLIQNISPFFTKIAGQTHHRKRYSSFPPLVAVGILPHEDKEGEQIFTSLAERNARNLHSCSETTFVYRYRRPADALQLGWM
ncbi:MAG TPA: NAD(P)H-dependent oxidoreductase [Acidobacteriota bacterium]